MSGNPSNDKNDFNYQQELSRFLHIGCSKPTGCRIIIVEKPNLILEARYCGELVGKICNFFYPHVLFSPLHGLWVFNTVVHDLGVSNPVCMLKDYCYINAKAALMAPSDCIKVLDRKVKDTIIFISYKNSKII